MVNVCSTLKKLPNSVLFLFSLAVYEGYRCSTFLPKLTIVGLLNLTVLVVFCGFSLHSLMTNAIMHLFMYYLQSVRETVCPLKTSDCLTVWYDFFYVLDTSPLPLCFIKFFSQTGACYF